MIKSHATVISDARGLAFLRWLESCLRDQIVHVRATGGHYFGGSERLLSWVSHAVADIERSIERRSQEAHHERPDFGPTRTEPAWLATIPGSAHARSLGHCPKCGTRMTSAQRWLCQSCEDRRNS